MATLRERVQATRKSLEYQSKWGSFDCPFPALEDHPPLPDLERRFARYNYDVIRLAFH